MANPTGNNAAAGDFARTTGIEVISRKCDATGVSKGQVCMMDTNGLVVKGTAAAGIQSWGFCVALEAVAANADGRFAIGNTYIYVGAGGAIIPFNAVAIISTIGEVGSHDEPADAVLNTIFAETEAQDEIDLVRDYFGKFVGRYIGHQLEEVGDPTDAADNDTIIVRLGL